MRTLLFFFCLALSCAAETVPSLFIEGYAARQSCAPGEELAFHVSTSAPKFSAEIARLGLNREVVWHKAGLAGQELATPEDASSMGCRWPESFSVPIAKTWKTGYYEMLLHAEDGGGKYTERGRRTAESTLFFVVKAAAPGKTSKVLIELCTNTYAAYNNWGGFSLYAFHGKGKNQGNRVSFERPCQGQYARWELPFVQWAESHNIALEFATNADLEHQPELLEHYKLVLSVGHDEYWSTPMRDNLEAWIGRGGNVAFFTGNTCCWQVRTEDEGHALTCWKQNYHWDPVYGAREDYSTLSTLWSHYVVKRPENTLTGVGFLWGGYHKSHGQLMDGSGAFTTHRPEHWVFEGTGLKRGDEFGGKGSIVGYECDGCHLEWKDGLPFPTHEDGTPQNFEVLCTAPASWHPDDSAWYDKWENGRKGNAVMGLYTRGGTVFTCGTTDWARGLKVDARVDQITRNIIARLSK